jgi:hypothetical protein
LVGSARACNFSGIRKCQSGRPKIPACLQHLIRKMACENPSWGEERIANELLLKLGLRMSPRTIRKYMKKLLPVPGGRPRSDQRSSNLPQESRPSHFGLRLLRCSLPRFEFCSYFWSWNTLHVNDSRQRDRPSDRSLDPPTVA